MLGIAGLPKRESQHCDGKSFVSVLKGKKAERGAVTGIIHTMVTSGGAPGSAIREGNWKLIRWYEDSKTELSNLKDDIGETKNLAEKYPDITRKLNAKLDKWLEEVDAKYPSPNPNRKTK